MALLLLLWVQGHSPGRKGSAWKLRGLSFPLKPKWHHTHKKFLPTDELSGESPMNDLWSVAILSVTLHSVPPPPSCKGHLCQYSPPFPLSQEWTMPFMQRLTCASPEGLISLCFIAMLMKTRSSPGHCLPTLHRYRRDFRKLCLIGAAPGKAHPWVYWLSAELEQEIIWEKSAAVSPLPFFGASSCPGRFNKPGFSVWNQAY